MSLAFPSYYYRRRKTRVVMVGTIAVGGDNPIRLQSMTTTSTMDTRATVEQVKRLADVGCEIARITAPTVNEARNLEKIKADLLRSNCHIPLVADIHFRPDAAMIAADFVEKVRINPGNFTDSKSFKVRDYSDMEYEAELARIEEKFTPLVLKLKNLKKSLRIGTNHGSLSDRILNRFGDTPLGMVESALEFVRICRRNDYHDIILSMKASNPKVMIAAYRLLAFRMGQEGMDYPFHLGVTEAGNGPDGRIKSAAGIGSLLEDGIGDTIRVSLTEDPEFEIPVAKEIADRYLQSRLAGVSAQAAVTGPYINDPFSFSRREAAPLKTGPIDVGGHSPIRIASYFHLTASSADKILALMESRVKRDVPPEILIVPAQGADFAALYSTFRERLKSETHRLSFWVSWEHGQIPDRLNLQADGLVYSFKESLAGQEIESLIQKVKAARIPLVVFKSASFDGLVEAANKAADSGLQVMGGLTGPSLNHVYGLRLLAARLKKEGLKCPIFLESASSNPNLDTAIVQGSLILDGIGDVICASTADAADENLDYSYNMLQACGDRLTKTDFVSCPSCGRTLFDLQTTTERIKSKVGHLKGVKIAIMGCIVNGPGEMADADFGYVGGGPGKINLYVGKTCVQKSISADIADAKLIELIKENGKWVDPT